MAPPACVAPAEKTSACGLNGACEPKKGESRKSCPVDCNFAGKQGKGLPCQDAYDCVFYDWPHSQPGCWECQPHWDKKCSTVQTKTYCGTVGYNYCYMEPSAFETDLSCPQDCANKPLDCGAASQCIFHDWPG